MQLLAPLALVFAALALVVLAFHIRRRRNIAVPSLVIWRQLQMGQVRRNRIWQWPNPSWSLFLQLLAVLAMVAALAQPLVNRAPPVDHWIYVLDRSGPMQALDEGETLFAQAGAALRSRLAGAAGAGRQSLLAVGAQTQPILVNQPIGTPGMSEAVASIAAEDGPADWSKLPETLRPLIAGGEATRVVIYSDRSIDLPVLSETVSLETSLFDSDTPNAAIAATIEQDPDKPNSWTLSGSVRLDPGQAATEVVVGFANAPGEQPLEWSRRTIGNPDAAAADTAVTKSFSTTLDLPGPGIVSATLSDDGNTFDNVARFVVPEAPPTLDVLYLGAGNQPLLTALRAVGGTQVFQAPQLPADLGPFGLVIVDNQFVDRQPESNVLWIGNAGIGSDALAAMPATAPTAANAAHPLMRDVDWTTITTGERFALPSSANAEVLLRAGDQPLMIAEPSEFGRNIALAFDPRNADWLQQPSMPVFAANLVDWLGLAAKTPGTSCQVGATCRLDRRFEGGTITQLTAETPFSAIAIANWVPTAAGLYEVAKGEHRTLLAVNAAEAEPGAGGETTQPADFPLPLWPILIGLAALALLAEAIVSGRGAERFLVADGLRKNNPLSTRRRIALVLHVVVLALAIAAMLNAPLPARQAGETLVQVIAPGGVEVDGVDRTIFASTGDDNSGFSGAAQSGLALAAASIPWNTPGHIFVSGNTFGEDDDLSALTDTLRQRDIVLDTSAFSPNEDALYVSALEAPDPVFSGDTFQLVGIVHSAIDQPATLRFERDGETLVEQQVALVAGDNRVETIISDVTPGGAHYRLTATGTHSGNPANDALSRWIEAGDAGQVAVIANDPARGAAFAAWLEGQGITGTVIEPDRVPYRPRDWAAYGGAVLIDVPAIALTTLQQEQLESAVADQGMGLLILGGPNSFGPGGYLETPLEDASPLSSRVPRDAPEATLVFVLDRSGSMQQAVGNGTRLDVAKQATLSAIDLLNQNSQVGIIVFDSEATTVLPLSRISDPAAVSAALTSVDPGGGTSVYPGLEAAYRMLEGVDTPARHIIVMTDGLSQPGDFPGLLSQIRAAGITVSSVSIGEGAERGLIEEIARLGGGSFHATDDFAALPSILSQEAMLLSGSPIETGTTQPLWASRDEPFLRGLPATMPPIDGFVLTTAKPAAQLSMVVPDSKGEPMPLLASWRFGAGQVLALTTEAVGPWSSQWQQMDSYAPLWAQVIRQFLPGVAKGDAVLDLVRQGDGILADITLRNAALETVPQLVVTSDRGEPTILPLSKTGTGLYRATYYPGAVGSFRFDLTAGELATSQTLALDYQAHLGSTAPDQALRQLAVQSGGAVDVALPVLRNLPDRWVMSPAWPVWLALALALFMVELTVRYTRLFAPKRQPTGNGRPFQTTPATARPRVGEPVHT